MTLVFNQAELAEEFDVDLGVDVEVDVGNEEKTLVDIPGRLCTWNFLCLHVTCVRCNPEISRHPFVDVAVDTDDDTETRVFQGGQR